MTASEWEDCSDPLAMLAFLGPGATERKRNCLREAQRLQIVDLPGGGDDDEYRDRQRSKCDAHDCDVIRCMFNPFSSAAIDHPTPAIVLSLAEAAFENSELARNELEWDRIAVLSDALEEFGLQSDLVSHLRDSSSHWRGCWVIDMILGLS